MKIFKYEKESTRKYIVVLDYGENLIKVNRKELNHKTKFKNPIQTLDYIEDLISC
jgi:hypothetical protein